MATASSIPSTTESRPHRSRLSLVRKIVLIAVIGGLAALLIGASDLWTSVRIRSAIEEANRLQSVQKQLLEIKVMNGEISGWQAVYAWETRRMSPRQAVSDTNESRKAFLDYRDRLGALLKSVPQDALTAEEQQVFADISAAWDGFFAADSEAVALYRQNTPAATNRADAIITGKGWDEYGKVGELTPRLATLIDARIAQLGKDAAAVETMARLTQILAILLCLAALTAISVWVIRSIREALRDMDTSLAAMAEGDLTVEPRRYDDDELG